MVYFILFLAGSVFSSLAMDSIVLENTKVASSQQASDGHAQSQSAHELAKSDQPAHFLADSLQTVPAASRSLHQNAPVNPKGRARLQAMLENEKDAGTSRAPILFKTLNKRLVQHFTKTCHPDLKALIDVYKKVFSEPHNRLYRAALQRKIIFVGPPGVGKSMLARACAEECNVPYIFKSAPAIPNEYKNSGVTKLDELFQPLFEPVEPIFLILDEFGGLTDKYNMPNNPDAGMIEHLLTLLDECDKYWHIVVILTFNNIQNLPSALENRLRGSIFRIDPPNESESEVILTLYLEDVPHEITKEDVKQIIAKCRNFVGRELGHLLRLAALNAIKAQRERVIKGDLLKAYQELSRNHSWTSNYKQRVKKLIISVFPYAFSAASIGLTVTSLYLQWQASQQHALFHAQQMAHSAKQMRQSASMHTQQMMFNIIMHNANVKEQTYKEAFQLFMRTQANDRADAGFAVDKYLADPTQINSSLVCAHAIADNAQKFAQTPKAEKLIEAVETAAQEFVESQGAKSGHFQKLMPQATNIPLKKDPSCTII